MRSLTMLAPYRSGVKPELIGSICATAQPIDQTKLSWRILSTAVLARKDVGPAAKVVLLVLQGFGRDGKPCFPAIQTIADAGGLSSSTVKRALSELEQLGMIRIINDDPKMPKGRRIDRLWMDDPTLHPTAFPSVRLVGQNEPIRCISDDSLAVQNDLRPRRSNCSRSLGGQIDPQERVIRDTLRRLFAPVIPKSQAVGSSSGVPEPGDQEPIAQVELSPIEAIAQVLVAEPLPLPAPDPRFDLPAFDRVMATIEARQVQPEDSQADPKPRQELIAAIDRMSQGDTEVRRAILDAVPPLLKKLEMAGSTSPHDHVRMALEKSSGRKNRRDSIESLARGIVKNWVAEGLPAINAPTPPALKRSQPILARDIILSREAEARTNALADAARQAAWDALPADRRAEIKDEVEARNPGLKRLPRMIESLCLASLEFKGALP